MSGNGEHGDGNERPTITPDRARQIADGLEDFIRQNGYPGDFANPAVSALRAFAEQEETDPTHTSAGTPQQTQVSEPLAIEQVTKGE